MIKFVHSVIKVPYGRLGFLDKVLCQGLVHPHIVAAAAFSSSASRVSSVVLATNLSPSTPWLMLSPEIDEATGGKVDRFYSPIRKQVFKLNRKSSLQVPDDARCIASTRGWLGFIDTNSCSLYVSNPFHHLSQPKALQLPSIQSLPSILGIKRKPTTSSIDRFIVTGTTTDDNSKYYSFRTPEVVSSIIGRIALSIDPAYHYLFKHSMDQEDCIVMISYDYSNIAFCRLMKDNVWTSLPGSHFDRQIVYSQKEKLFYTLFGGDIGIESWDIQNPWKPPTRAARFKFDHQIGRPEFSGMKQRYFVVDESSFGDDHVMLVNRDMDIYVHPEKTLSFDVYKVNMSERRVEHIKCIGDRAIFLGLNHSFCLSATEFPGLKPNSIYFTDDSLNERLGHDTGIYSLEDNSITPCYPFVDELKKGEINPPPLIWVAPTSYC